MGNGVAEVFNFQIELKSVAMMRDNCAAKKTWELTSKFANQLRNIMPIKSQSRPELADSSPYEQWYGKKPSLEFVRKFFSHATPLQQGSRLGSMDPAGRSKEGTWVYVGLAERSPGFRLLDLRTGSILETVDAKIDEDTTSRRDALTGLLKPLAPEVWGDKATGEIADEVRSAFDGSYTQRLDLLEAAPHPAEELEESAELAEELTEEPTEEPAEEPADDRTVEPLGLPALDDNEEDGDEALDPDPETTRAFLDQLDQLDNQLRRYRVRR